MGQISPVSWIHVVSSLFGIAVLFVCLFAFFQIEVKECQIRELLSLTRLLTVHLILLFCITNFRFHQPTPICCLRYTSMRRSNYSDKLLVNSQGRVPISWEPGGRDRDGAVLVSGIVEWLITFSITRRPWVVIYHTIDLREKRMETSADLSRMPLLPSPARHCGNACLALLSLVWQLSSPLTFNSVKVEIKFHLECKLHFPCTQLLLRQMHLTNVSRPSIEFLGLVLKFNKCEYELWKLHLNSPSCAITADS